MFQESVRIVPSDLNFNAEYQTKKHLDSTKFKAFADDK